MNKKSIIFFSIFLYSSLIFAGNSLSGLINSVSNIFATNIYCPKTVLANDKYFYANTNDFSSGSAYPKITGNKTIKFYFKYATFAGSAGASQCRYKTQDNKLSYTLYPKEPIKPNVDAISNNWYKPGGYLYDQLDKVYGLILICRYNNRHCPFMNY